MEKHYNDTELIELLQELVRSPSINPPADTSGCARLLRSLLEKEKIDTQVVEPLPGRCNVVAVLSGHGAGKKLVLNGHLDVVPPGEQWTYDPFGGEIVGDSVYGRGTCDMKSGVAAMTIALIAFKRSGIPFNGEIVLQAVADEETGSEWGTRYLLEQGYGAKADFAICTEPTSNRIELGNRGLRWIDVSVRGLAAHAGRPHLGRNAVSIAARLIEAIDRMSFTIRNDFFEVSVPSISVTIISGGHTVNVIPERCDFSIDRRMLPGETESEVLDQIQAAIAPILASDEGVEVALSLRKGFWNPYLLDPSEPIVQSAVAAYREVAGSEPTLGSKAACTDASHLTTLAGIPTILFGPGNEQLSHKADEHVAIDALMTATDVYVRLFERLLRR